MKVKDLLTKKSSVVITVTADQPLLAASRLLTKHAIGALVVVDSAGLPIGILSESDIVHAFAHDASGIISRTVADVMATDLIVCVPDDELQHLSSIMTRHRVRHLPVVSNNELLGIVSLGDVVKALLDHAEGEAITRRLHATGNYS